MEKKKRIILPNLGAVLWETINLIPHLKVKVLLSSSEAVKAKMNENLKIWDCKSLMKSDQKRSENVYTNILGRLLAIPCNWNIFCFLYQTTIFSQKRALMESITHLFASVSTS